MRFNHGRWRIEEPLIIVLVLAFTLAAQREQDRTQITKSVDIVTVADGTPLVLCLKQPLSSASAKVGDTVEFVVFAPVVVGELLLVRQGTTLSGTVVMVRHRGRFGKDGEVKLAIQDLLLRDGKIVSVRQTLKQETEKGKTALAVERTAVESIPTFGLMLPMSALIKGEEKVYPAASVTTVYINGSFTLNRRAWAALPYKGPAQVFFKNADADSAHLFMGANVVGQWDDVLLVEFRPGKYSFSTEKPGEPLQLDLHNDQQYWVEKLQGTLIAGDVQQHAEEIEKLVNDPEVAVREMLETPK